MSRDLPRIVNALGDPGQPELGALARGSEHG